MVSDVNLYPYSAVLKGVGAQTAAMMDDAGVSTVVRRRRRRLNTRQVDCVYV